MPAHKGPAHHNAKLTAALVAEMRARKATGQTIFEIIEWLLMPPRNVDITYNTARQALVGATWAHVPLVETKECEGCNGKGRVPV